MALETSYTAAGAGSASPSNITPGKSTENYWPLSKLRRAYTDYLFSKREEMNEQVESRRYYHGSQWTADQIAVMKKRKQPVMTFNRISRKIDGVVGLIEKLRQDPKAFARTPQHEEGAELATASLRYVLDEQEWKAKSPIVAQDGAVDGVGGVEIDIVKGDQGDPEIGLEIVDIQSFFYDPRSYKYDFSDARYQGIGKWLDEDVAREMFPDANFDMLSSDSELTSSSDREARWYSTEGVSKRVRVVDIWYKHQGGECWAVFTGSAILMEGKAYLKDEKGKDLCKYIMFSGNVDQDGDRYGFIRNMKSAQDGINAKQSRMQHMLHSKRLFISNSSVQDVEKTRNEYARNDGVIVTVGPVNEAVKSDDIAFDFAGMTKMLELNLTEIENFGPNPALIGQGLESQSGRAIQLLQQAGMAELGPYILAYRGWKLRVYRAIWNAIQQHWQGERWIRVTDSDSVAQYIAVNKLEKDPITGQPSMVNPLGQLDVDIIMDEGPDHVNGMADVHETLSNIMPSIAPLMNPIQAQNIIGVLMETSPLPPDVKKRFKDQSEQAAQQPPPPDPAIEAAKVKQQIDMESAQHTMQLDQAKAQHDAQLKQQVAQADIELSAQKTAAEIEEMRIKNAVALEVEKQKAEIQAGLKIHEHQLNCEQMDRQSQYDMAGEDRQAKHENDKHGMAMMQIGEKSKAESEKPESIAVKSIAKAIEMLAESLNKPKKITVQRNQSGQVTGAVEKQ